MRKVYVCDECGSARVFMDAFASMNTDEVRTYDYTYCDDCEEGCSVSEVEVADDFDVETDFYKGETA